MARDLLKLKNADGNAFNGSEISNLAKLSDEEFDAKMKKITPKS